MALNDQQLQILTDELNNDPLSRGYAAMTDPQSVVNDLEGEYRSRIRSSMTSSEIFQSVDKTEFLSLADGHQNLIMNLLAFGALNPQGNEVDIFIQVFGLGSQTIQNLNQARQEPVSRAVELGIGGLRAADVVAARD